MRVFYFLLLPLIICFSGCSKPKNTESSQWFEKNSKLKVLTTTAMIKDVAEQIGNGYVDVVALIQGQLDPHSYELVKGDDEKFACADIIFFNGLGLEHGHSLRQNLDGNPKAVSVGDPILREDPNLILVVEGQYDPHIWMDIALWKKTVGIIERELSKKDPMHADQFRASAQKLIVKMDEADQNAYQMLQAIPESKRYLVTSHDAFNYFARHYLAGKDELSDDKWKDRVDAPEGLAPDSQLSVSDIQAILSHIKKFDINILFPESNVSKDSLKKIVDACKKQGREVRMSSETLYGDSMGEQGTEEGTYLGMIKHNVNVISKELSQ